MRTFYNSPRTGKNVYNHFSDRIGDGTQTRTAASIGPRLPTPYATLRCRWVSTSRSRVRHRYRESVWVRLRAVSSAGYWGPIGDRFPTLGTSWWTVRARSSPRGAGLGTGTVAIDRRDPCLADFLCY